MPMFLNQYTLQINIKVSLSPQILLCHSKHHNSVENQQMFQNPEDTDRRFLPQLSFLSFVLRRGEGERERETETEREGGKT